MGPICGPFGPLGNRFFDLPKVFPMTDSMGLAGIFPYMKNHRNQPFMESVKYTVRPMDFSGF